MNILIFSWRGPNHPNAGGAEISTHEHAKRWVKEGSKVTLFTSYYVGAKKEEVVDEVNIIRRGKQIFGVHIEAFFWYLFENKEKFDLVIDQFHGIPFFTPLYVRSKKLGFIHEVTKEVWKLNSLPLPFNLIPSFFGSFLEPLIFMIFYKKIPFMTVSASTKDDLTYWGIPAENITIIHNGINLPKIGKLPEKEKLKTLIYLGAIAKDKGIEDAIKAFGVINQKEAGWQFWIVGKADKYYLEDLKMLTKNVDVEKNTKFLGYVSETEKYNLLAKAHILINPSIREGWGLVVIEAAAVGTPTVGYNVPGLKDSVIQNKTGILSEINYKICAENILALAGDKSKYERFRVNCVSWSKKFSWGKSSKLSLDLIKKIVKNEKPNE